MNCEMALLAILTKERLVIHYGIIDPGCVIADVHEITGSRKGIA